MSASHPAHRPSVALGARVLREGAGAGFRVWAPRASEVKVRITSGECAGDWPLSPADAGYFEGICDVATAGSDYFYRLDGGDELPDPASRWQPSGVRGPSRIVAPYAAWSDRDWTGIERADLVFYELHVGTFSREGTFEGVARALGELRSVGISALELMPIAEFPGTRNWGYDGVFPFAPQSSYGGPGRLAALVDAAHEHGLAVFLDVVYNHLGPEGNVLPRFGPYFTSAYRTAWGDALNFDGPDSDAVRQFFVENACYWIDAFHLDGLRLDAVHAIFDRSPVPIVQEITEAVHTLGERLGRRVHVVAETDENNPRYVRSPARGGYGIDAIWSDDFHHAVHVGLTGERAGYYADFDGPEALRKAFRDRFVLDGGYSPSRRRRHGAPAQDVPRDHFIVAIQNHDQVGNRTHGERLAALVSPEKARVGAALLLLSPYLPLLFMGEEYGETQPFLYFVSHQDEELQKAVRHGRRAEFASQRDRSAPPPPDPYAEGTFVRSKLHRDRASSGRHAQQLALYRELLALRRSLPALRPGSAEIEVARAPAGPWLATYATRPGARRTLALFVWAAERIELLGAGTRCGWERVLDSEETRFGGSGARTPEHIPRALHQREGTALRIDGPVAALFVETDEDRHDPGGP